MTFGKRIAVMLLLGAILRFLMPMSASGQILGPILYGNSAGGGGGNPAFNSATSCTSGGTTCTTGTVTAGHALVVLVGSNSTGATITVSDNHSDTFTQDGAGDDNGIDFQAKAFHCFSVSTTATYTITIAGATTPTIYVLDVSNISALETVSVGANPSFAHGTSTTPNPSAFTTSDNNVILVDFFADVTGGTTTIAQTDTNYTTQGTPCTNGGSCFVSAVGTRIVSATGSYSDGWTLGTGSSWTALHVAYK